MKAAIGCLIGLVFVVSVWAEPVLEGRVRLSSGQPAVGVQVRLFDLTDLRRFVGTTTDEAGHFALPLRAFSMTRGTALPTDFVLGPNYPNPFNPSTIIPYQLPTATHVRLEVFNLLGQRIATLVDEERAAGFHTATWHATDGAGRAVAAGVYIYRMTVGIERQTGRMVLIDGQAGVPAAAAGSMPMQASALERVEAAAGVYGLTVSGEGLVAYVNPAFRVGVDEADIVVEEHSGRARMKLLAGGILGDVNNDGQVDASDALYISLYSRNPSVVLPNNGDISLGDVNGDGKVDGTDAILLIRYLADPSDPALPAGIGEPVGGTTTTALQRWKLYWTDSGTDKIQRSNLDGSRVEDLVTTGLILPGGLALDMSGGKLYWMDSGTDKIQRSNLDGSDVEDLVTTGLSQPDGLALDVSGGKLYWTDSGTDKIQRSNLDGSGVEDLVTTGLSRPDGLALDVSGGKLYWTDRGTDKIQRSNLDGSGVEDLVTTGLSRPGGLALDVSGGKLYWTDWGTAKIQRSNLDGSGVQDLVTTGLGSPRGLALDVSGGKLYWTDWGTAKIQRSNLNGSGVEDLVTTGLESPGGLALGFVLVEAGPDLVVRASVSNNLRTPGQSFTLSATVRNRGTEQAAATTLRYYRSDDATISTRDTRVGTDAVGALAAADSSAESISLTAPSSEGTYYYGACVESVSGESKTDNNCSSAVTVTVGHIPPGALVMAPGAARRHTRSFRANFSYDSLTESLSYDIASSDIDDGLLGLSDVDVGIQYETSSFWGRDVKEVTFSYNLRVSPAIPLNTTLRATIVYDIQIRRGGFIGGSYTTVATYTVSLVVFVGNDGSSSAKVIAEDAESSEQVRMQESLSRHPH